MFGRTDELEVPGDKIVSIDVEQEEKPGTDGRVSISYVATLVYNGRDGALRRERIFAWPMQGRAEQVAAWLREHPRVKPPTKTDA